MSALFIENYFFLCFISLTIVQVGWRVPNLSRATITAAVSLFDHRLLWSPSIVKPIYCEILNCPRQLYGSLCLWLTDWFMLDILLDISGEGIYLSCPPFTLCRHFFGTILHHLLGNVQLSCLRCCGAKTKFDIESPCSSRSSYIQCKRFWIETITWILRLRRTCSCAKNSFLFVSSRLSLSNVLARTAENE